MKNHLKIIFFAAFTITILALLYEQLSLILFYRSLKDGNYGVPNNSNAYQLAKEIAAYHKNMFKAVLSRLHVLKDKLFMTAVYTLLGCLILLDTPRLFIHKLSTKNINFYTKTMFDVNHVQVALANLFVFMFVTVYLSKYLEHYLDISKYNWVATIGLYFILYSLVCPAFVFVFFILFREFGAQLILAFYISLILKNVYEIFIEKYPTQSLKRLNAEEFSEPVQKLLKETNLEDKIFLDTDKSKETNAALVGMANDVKIEIYGDFNNLPEEQKDSILLHEIGHAKDHSLAKKLAVYFSTYYIELLIMLFIYSKASKVFECEKVSRNTSFVLLSIVYFVSMKHWVTMFYKMSSQRAEISADFIAKNSGYGSELAKSLLNISVKESSYIKPTWLYNALYAMHPSTYDRIEHLLE